MFRWKIVYINLYTCICCWCNIHTVHEFIFYYIYIDIFIYTHTMIIMCFIQRNLEISYGSLSQRKRIEVTRQVNVWYLFSTHSTPGKLCGIDEPSSNMVQDNKH